MPNKVFRVLVTLLPTLLHVLHLGKWKQKVHTALWRRQKLNKWSKIIKEIRVFERTTKNVLLSEYGVWFGIGLGLKDNDDVLSGILKAVRFIKVFKLFIKNRHDRGKAFWRVPVFCFAVYQSAIHETCGPLSHLVYSNTKIYATAITKQRIHGGMNQFQSEFTIWANFV